MHGASIVPEGGCSSEVPVQRSQQRLTGKKVSRVHDSLNDELDRNVSYPAERFRETCKVRFPEHDLIYSLYEYLERLRTIKTKQIHREIFSIDIDAHSNIFGGDHILLDTCAGESVFNNENEFYSLHNSDKPLLVSGVNAKGKPSVITQ